MSLASFWLKMRMHLCRFFGRRFRARDCRHWTRTFENMEVFGQKMDFTYQEKVGYCHKCFAGMHIRCAFCKGIIFPGDSITLKTPFLGNQFPVEDYMVIYKMDPLQLV